MQLYARVFTQILDSSLAENWQARHVFEDLLKLADDGIVDITRTALSRRLNIPRDVIDKAIAVLEGPDPVSRDPAEDGRRIVRLDAHRDWGWAIVNWEKYEEIRCLQDQRAKSAERVRRFRERRKGSPAPLPNSETDSEAEAEAPLPKRYSPLHGVTRAEDRAAGAAPTSQRPVPFDLDSLKKDPAYQGIDVEREYAKMLRWCEANHKQPTRRRLINWLNNCEAPIRGNTPQTFKTGEIDPRA